MRKRVVVIGAGIVGAIAALECLRDGHAVSIVDPEAPGGAHAASYGNGAWINTGSIMPVSTPGLWRKVPGFLRDPLGPFAIRASYLPRLLPWLARFVLAGRSVARVEAVARIRHGLVASTIDRHKVLATEAGLSQLIEHRGLLYVFPSRAEFAAAALEWRLRRASGVGWQEFDADELRRIEPGIGPGYSFGVLVPGGCHLTDPGAYVAGLVSHAQRLGATLVRTRATGFDIRQGRLAAVRSDSGDIAAEKALICAGIWSRALAHEAGDRIPLETERGYHVVVADPEYVPLHPIMPSDGMMALTMTRAGLRVAGQVELAGLAAAPDWRRAEILLDYLARVFPAIPRHPDQARLSRWMGHRPSTPDSLPSLGPASGCADVLHGFGHGHTGLSMAPVSARILADLVSDTPATLDISPFTPQRFRRRVS